MTGQNHENSNPSKLNRLQSELPAGLLATADWLKARGYYRQLLSHYVGSGWLESPARGVYRRPASPLKWQQVVASLQNLLRLPVHVGGLTALELQGKGHFVRLGGQIAVHLHAQARLPSWLHKLPLADRFVVHRSLLFNEEPAAVEDAGHVARDAAVAWSPPETGLRIGLTQLTWGEYDTPLTCSTLERAFLELLDDCAEPGSIVHANLILQGLTTLSPRRLQGLLAACRSVKVKRLFFALAERHRHQWVGALDARDYGLGKGKRQLVPGGRLHPKYLITLPAELDDAY